MRNLIPSHVLKQVAYEECVVLSIVITLHHQTQILIKRWTSRLRHHPRHRLHQRYRLINSLEVLLGHKQPLHVKAAVVGGLVLGGNFVEVADSRLVLPLVSAPMKLRLLRD